MAIKRLAVLDRDLCAPKKCAYECIAACPVNRQGIVCIDAEKEKKSQPFIYEDVCIGCSLCWRKCPFQAWRIVNLVQEIDETPIHRFGINSFQLFRLPVIVKGIVGLLGPNGAGKTTALQILSGQLKPNLGMFDSEPVFEDIIKITRGTELQSYFESMKDKKIKTVYKPQQISGMPLAVKEPIEKFIHDDIIKQLELENCESRALSELSGGELQRVAIGAALSKDADIYYFDEPTNYLDVKQRLNMAKALHKLAENKLVMVVDHDLATLDFLADRIHIFYGSPGVFGIVSKPYVAKTGINTFLSGYIKEENTKIREPIAFEETSCEKNLKKEILISFENIKKQYAGFALSVENGDIRREEIVGVLGPNALGKTTFAKILAGEIEFEGNINGKICISYKPQYLKSGYDGTVEELLSVVSSHSEFNILRKQLDADRLMPRIVSTLSGGELQRVSILLCLAKEADLYLLDEPSAFLDIEQRLAVAKSIRSRTAMIIDHDLLFLSYVSDRTMLFSGVAGKHGTARMMGLKDGFNEFLKSVDITFRRDPETKRPRANKLNSQKDQEQKASGEYFYSYR